jgi:hypothetical protein
LRARRGAAGALGLMIGEIVARRGDIRPRVFGAT